MTRQSAGGAPRHLVCVLHGERFDIGEARGGTKRLFIAEDGDGSDARGRWVLPGAREWRLVLSRHSSAPQREADEDGLNVKGDVAYVAAGPNGQYFAGRSATRYGGRAIAATASRRSVEDSASVREEGRVCRPTTAGLSSTRTDHARGRAFRPRLSNKVNGRMSNKRMARRSARTVAEIAARARGSHSTSHEDGSDDYMLPTSCADEVRNWEDAGWTGCRLLNSANGDGRFASS